MADKKKLKIIAGELKKASAMHKAQAKKIDSMSKGPSMINIAGAVAGLGKQLKNQKQSTAVGSVAPHSHDNSKDASKPIQPVSNITGNVNQNAKVEELGKQFFQGDQFANQYASRPPVDPAMPVPPQPDAIGDQYGNMFSPFSLIGGGKKPKDPKYNYVGVQNLQEKGKIFNDKKGPYVVNRELTGTSRDTLRLPKNVWKSTDGLIDDVEYRDIANKVNKN